MIGLFAVAIAQDTSPEPAVEPDVPVDTDVPADPPPEEPVEPEVFEIPPTDTPLPSATRRIDELERLSEGDLAAALEEAGLDPDLFDRPALIRGAWYVRPRLALHQLVRDGDDGTAVRLGVSAGRRWWTVEALPIQLAADLGLRATAPVGEGNGRRVELAGHIGPWLGPVRLELGAVARWERERWLAGSLELADAVHVGPELTAGLDARVLQLSLGVQPGWQVVGERPPAKDGDPVLPTLGDETVWSASLGIPLVPIGFVFDGSWRDTVVGGSLEVGLTLQLAFGRGQRAEDPE